MEYLTEMFAPGDTALEWAGAITGLIAVALTIRRSMWNYAFGIPCVVIYSYLFWQWQLYSQMILYLYYVVMLLAGIFWWLKGREADGRIVVVRSPAREVAVLALLVAVGIPALGWVMDTQFGAAVPYLDASTTVLAAAAQYLQSRRRLETYAGWTVVNVLSVYMFYVQGYMPTAAVYGVYLALGLIGLVAWFRAWKRQHDVEILV